MFLKFIIAIALFFTFFPSLGHSNDSCKQFLGSCEYYSCLEKQSQCGPRGYYQSFGLHYCNKYQNFMIHFSEQGKIFLNNIRLCLQTELENLKINPSCNTIKSLAVITHKVCYKRHNFCQLSNEDKFLVQWVAKKEITDPSFIGFAIYLQNLCSQ